MNLRRAFDTARWAVRAYPGSTALLAGASAITVGVTLPSLALGAGRLLLPPVPDPGLPIGSSTFAGTPATMQAQGVDAIAGLLVALGIAALVVGVVTAGSLAAGRAASRRPEIGVRRAVGAARSSLRLAGVAEGLLLALGALGVGLAPAVAAAHWAVVTWPGTLVPAFAGALAGMGAVGLVLMLGALAGVRAPGGARVPHAGGSSHGLVIPAVQFAISLAILMGAARTGARAGALLRGADGTGPRATSTVTEIENDGSSSTRASRYEALVRRLKSNREAGLVSVSSAGALAGMGPVDFVTTDCGWCVEGFVATPFRPVPAMITAMSADTFRAMGIPVLRGRGLADSDGWSAPKVAVISASLAARDYEEGVGVGRRIFVGSGAGSGWYRVVGVVPDRMAGGIGGALAPAKAVYLSAFQAPPTHVDLLTTGARPAPGVVALSGRVTGETTWAALRARDASVLVWFGRLTRAAGWGVMLIALAGMLAVMERWVTAVAPELALRRAVGARRWDVLRFVLARAGVVGAGGAAGGLWLAILVSGALEDAFPGLPAWSWPAALAIAGTLLAASALGALIPGWRVVAAAPATRLGALDG